MTKESIQIKELCVEVRRSVRRKVVEIVVERDAAVCILSPQATSREALEKILRQKLVWIYGKLGRKEEELHRAPKREYVTGEGFFYLGRKYRLKVLNRHESSRMAVPLSLYQGRYLMVEEAVPHGREHFVRWYSRKASLWLADRMGEMASRVGASPVACEIRDLSNRWGSCTEQGKVLIHWRAMLLPAAVIRYLLLHEMVHLIEHNHSLAFYNRLRAAVPDYEKIEEWLRVNGDEYDL